MDPEKLYVVFVHLASHEYAQDRRRPDGTWEHTGDNMRAAAREVFEAHPDKTHMLAVVVEHGGWHLDFYKDGRVLGSANDAAVYKPDVVDLVRRLNSMERVQLPSVRRPEYAED